MEIKFDIEYHELVVKEDIPKISKKEKNRIKQAIEEKLQTQPELFGKPLRKSLKNYRSLRVGDYRIIYRIQKQTIKIFIIQNRSTVYKKSMTRIP
jgi:mRNA interferase RelE/StbE